MKTLPNLPVPSQPRIVIIGAGFAGLRLVRSLTRKKWQVVLIDRNNYHQFQPLYYQVATSGLEPSSISFTLRKLFQGTPGFHFRMAELLSVDAGRKEVTTSIGTLGYDVLVLAMGATTNFFGNRDIEANSLAMKSVSQAIRMRNLLLENYEQALNRPDPSDQERLMNIVVVGGGPTGVELAGSIADMKKFVFPRDYPELDFNRMNIYLVEAAGKVLSTMSDFASRKAHRYLTDMGIQVRTGVAVEQYDGHRVLLSSGEALPTQTVLWAAGVKVPEIPGLDQADKGRGGRMAVDSHNRLIGYEDVYVIGDQAFMTDSDWPAGHPQVAQPAIQQARLLAMNLERIRQGQSPVPFRYRDKGSMATIGRNRAVADIGRLHIGGFAAWLIWILVHLMAIVGSKNRFFIFINWAWNYLTYDQSLRLIIRPGADQ